MKSLREDVDREAGIDREHTDVCPKTCPDFLVERERKIQENRTKMVSWRASLQELRGRNDHLVQCFYHSPSRRKQKSTKCLNRENVIQVIFGEVLRN
jgi:hypothetical protein